jgi:glycosyltransferase involved in cell wall biosynthesis
MTEVARRLLVLCYFYPPLGGGGVHRVLGFTRHLPRQGWECTVICAGREDYWVVDETLLDAIPAGTEVVRVPGGSALSMWLRLRGGGQGRRSGRVFDGLRALSDWWMIPDSYAGWADRAARAGARRIGDAAAPRFDALLSTSPPDSVQLAGLALKRRFGLPWIADFRDPWFGLTFRTPRTAWHRARHERLERDVLEAADVVTAASASHADDLRRRMPGRADAVVHLPNGYEPDDPSDTDRAPEAAPDSDRFRLVYTGRMSIMPDVLVFLDALHQVLARRPDARRRLRARLAGPYDSDYEDRALALGLKGIVEFLGPRSHREARALQRGADLLLLWKPRHIPTMVPGKLYEYLDAGRPIVAVLERGDEVERLVTRAGGEVVWSGDREGLTAAIERHYAGWREGLPNVARRPEWLDEHTRERLAGALARRLDTLVGARR